MVGSITIYNPTGATLLSTTIGDESRYTHALMGEHSIRVRFDAVEAKPLPYGSYIEYEGERWCIYASYIPIQKEGKAVYDVAFHAPEAELKNFTLFYMSQGVLEATFDLTGTIEQFSVEVRHNLWRTLGAEWGVEYHGFSNLDAKHIEFDGATIFDALGKIAEAFSCEWWVSGKTIHFGKLERNGVITAKIGELAQEFEPQGDGNPLISRLYAFGSTRNLTRQYRSVGAVNRITEPRLHLPVSTPYIAGVEHGVEAVQRFEDVYPRYVGTVSNVSSRQSNDDTIYRISDDTFVVPADKIIEGQPLMIKFESGALAGMEFEAGIVSGGYDLVPNDTYGMRLPSGNLVPKQSDTYIPYGFDISLVSAQYVTQAEAELLRVATEWLTKNNQDRRDVELTTNPVWAYRNSIQLSLGQSMRLVNAIPTGDKVGRITRLEYPLHNPYAITATIGEAKPMGVLTRLDGKIESEATKVKGYSERKATEARMYTDRGIADALEAMQALNKAMGDKYDPAINPIALHTMQAVLGDMSCQFSFIRSISDDTKVTPTISYTPSSRKVSVSASYIKHHTLGITGIKPKRPLSELKRWALPAYTSQAIDYPERQYYLYAKASKETISASYMLSHEPIGVEQIGGYYHLLVAIVGAQSSDGGRAITPLYGYTEVLPGQISTDLIVSTDGSTYFDLVRGEIGGNIKFRGGRDAKEYIDDLVQSVVDDVATTKAEIDLRATDQNKYYPVCIYLIDPRQTSILRYHIYISRLLSGHGEVGHSTHSASRGYSMVYEWAVNASAWGAVPINREVKRFEIAYVEPGVAVASQPTQYEASSIEYVYLRGGSRYYVEVEGHNDIMVEAYPEGVTLGQDLDARYQLTLSPRDSIADILPTTDLESIRAQVAKEYIKTAEHNAKIADLQRQIDGEISNWFGAGVPTATNHPASQWTTPEAKQRHTGDTYTTTDNYPLAHAGKSWRWMGSNWVEIADSDAVRALNVAREARATADGKTTTYLTRPNAYQVGDSWVLSADQQVGSTPYTRGTILYATTASQSYNPAHWVRYDTYITEAEAQRRVDAVQVSGRNLVLGSSVARDTTTYHIDTYKVAVPWEAGEYSVSIWAEVYGKPQPSSLPEILVWPDGWTTSLGVATLAPSSQMVDGAYRGMWTLASRATAQQISTGKSLVLYLLGNQAGGVRWVVKRISIVRGNRPPMDWTAAPEDVAEDTQRRVQQALSADYLRRVIKEGSTTIEGGLLATNVIALSPTAGSVSAYVNGDPARRVAFAAGVAGFGTPQESRVVEIMHDGNASLGDVRVDPNGKIEFRKNNADQAYMTIGGNTIAPLETLISKSIDVITTQRQTSNITEYFSWRKDELMPYMRQSVVLSSGAQRTTIGMRVRAQGVVDLDVYTPPPGGTIGDTSPSIGGVMLLDPSGKDTIATPANIMVHLFIAIGNDRYSIGGYHLDGWKQERFNIDYSIIAETESAVSIEAEIYCSIFQSGQTARATMSSFSLSGEKRHEEFNNIHFAPGGAVYLYSADRYVYISKADSNVMSVGGNVLVCGDHRIEGNLEVTGAVTSGGSLARGEVNRAGHIVWCNGCRAIPAGRPTGLSELLSDKSYKVYHNVGHTHYAVSITPTEDTAPICACVIERTPSYFRVMLRKGSDWNMATNKISSAFMYTIDGNLTAQ